ncbi:MAG: LysM peptidoglycan-binding domain-containing protein, partial [Anaerolineae bacterium]|nr:LysM peptidoglycan-binding domain-containing protein [Anaerolineae bacterium]
TPPTWTPTFGPTATFTSVPFSQPMPTWTYTPYMPPQPTAVVIEAQPLAERPPEGAVPTVDGQGGMMVVTETPYAVAQVPTLSPNLMTATAIIFNATATAAAQQGIFMPTLTPLPGQEIYQPVWTPTSPFAASGVTTGTPVYGQDCVYIVAPGDRLYRIAEYYRLTAAQIAQRNNIVNPDMIYAGAELIIPGCGLLPTGTALPGTATAVPGNYPVTGPFTYIVEPGDNIYRISLRYNVSMTALMQANGLTPATIGMIYAGQELYIPASTAAPVQQQQVIPTLTPIGGAPFAG